MTIVLRTRKSAGNQIKGEIRTLKSIRSIVEEQSRYRFIVNEWYETIWSKSMCEIVSVTE